MQPVQPTQATITPEERLRLSRSEIVNLMQNGNPILHILKPVLVSYAKDKPMKTLGIAVGVGAALVILKPWRLITIGGLLAVFKARL